METSEEDRTRRKQIIEERRNHKAPSVATKPSPSSSAATIDITSDDEDDDDVDDEDYDADTVYEFNSGVLFISEDDWEEEYDNVDYYNGLSGAYYGGYGVCYSCGERGHWANGCPSNPRRRRN